MADRKLNVAEVTQSEIGQKQKLQTVLEAVHDLLRPHGWTIKWNVDCKDIAMLSVSASQAEEGVIINSLIILFMIYHVFLFICMYYQIHVWIVTGTFFCDLCLRTDKHGSGIIEVLFL